MSLEQLVKDWDPLFESLVPGLGPLQRAALWGQTPQESNAKPDAEEFPDPTKGGKGLWQHTGTRLKNTTETEGNPLGLYEFARRAGKPWSDIETQVRFVAYEFHKLPAAIHALEQLQKTSSPEAAAGTAMAYFEGPQDWEKEIQHPGSTTANLPRRIEGTYQALAVIQAAQPGANPMVDNPPTPITNSSLPAPSNDPTVNGLADWIINNEVAAQQVIKGLLVANGVPGFAVDLAFQIATPLFNQAIKNIHPDDIAKMLVGAVQHIFSNLPQNKTA